MFTDYVAWRKKNPSDDLITELLSVEFEDETGTTRRLTTEELLIFLAVVAGAGVETTGRLFGWMGKVLAEHPDQRQELVDDRSLIPGAIEELLRYEPPGPHVARYVAAADVEFQGQIVPAGGALLIMLASANRDDRQFDQPDRFDIHRKPGGHLTFGRGSPLLCRCAVGAAGRARRPRRGAEPIPQVGYRHRLGSAVAYIDRSGLDSMPAIVS